MKFLYFTDSQADDMQPSCRSDLFTRTLLNKFIEIGKIARSEQVDMIFCGGDFLDQPFVPYSFLNQLIEILKDYHTPIRLVLGNHDIIGYNLDSYRRSAIGVLEKAEVIIVQDKNQTFDAFNFHFIPFNQNHTVELYKDVCNLSIAITHNSIIPCEKIPCFIPFDHLHPVDIYNYLLKMDNLGSKHLEDKNILILSGHTHGFYNILYNGIRFANPGSLARVTREHAEFRRSPCVFIVEGADSLNVRIKYLESAPSWESILIEKKEKETTASLDLGDLRELFFSKKSQLFNISEVIKTIGKQKSVDEAIIIESLNRMEVK